MIAWLGYIELYKSHLSSTDNRLERNHTFNSSSVTVFSTVYLFTPRLSHCGRSGISTCRYTLTNVAHKCEFAAHCVLSTTTEQTDYISWV